MKPDPRRSPRIPFVASAEITDVLTETRFRARTTDICQHGCYVDMLNPLALGAAVKVRIVGDVGTFGATAGVVYCHLHLGMGLVFQEIEPAYQLTLQKWLDGSGTV